MLSLRVVSILLGLAIHWQIVAQIPATKVKALTVEDGLPQGFVINIVQDKQGFMWFSTNDGLARYDGRQFLIFQHSPKDSNSISTNAVGSIYADSLNRLWLEHESKQVDMMDLNTGKILHVPFAKMYAPLKGKDISGRVSRIVEFRGIIYYIFHNHGGRSSEENRLCWYDWRTAKSGIVSLPSGEEPLYIDRTEDGPPLVRTNKALYKLSTPRDLAKWSDFPVELGAQLEAYNHAYASHGIIKIDRNGNLIQNTHTGIWTLDRRSKDWQYREYPQQMVNKSLKDFALGPDGQIYLSCQGAIYKVLPEGSFELLWINEANPNDIISMMVDRTNIMWVGTNTFGLRKIDLNNSGFRSYPIKNKFAYNVIPEQAGISVNRYYRNAMEKESFTHRSALDKKNNLWIANYIYDSVQGIKLVPNSFVRIGNGVAEVVNVGIGRTPGFNGGFCFDSRNQCWAINYDGKLYRVDLNNRLMEYVGTVGLTDNAVLSMNSNREGLWLIYANAVVFYDPRSGTTKVFRDQKGLSAFRTGDLLMAVPDPDNDNIFWITSRGNGLIRFDPRNANARPFTTAEGIPNNTVYAVVPDGKGFLWCSGNKGIFRFNRKDFTSISFTVKDGLQGNEFNRFQYLQLNNKIIFGGTEGYTVFDPDSVAIDNNQPVTKLTGLLVNNEPISTLPGWNMQMVANTAKMILDHDQNFLTFSFAALQYNAPEVMQYRYWMVGVDKNWINIGTNNTANYTNLSPGEYTLKLNASNTAGIWSPRVTTIVIEIRPPWWRTWWAYAFYILAIAGVMIRVFRFRLNQAKAKQEMELKRKEAEQLKAMDEMKSRFFSNITHEFRTPLSLIISPLEQVNRDPEVPKAVREQLFIVQRNAKQLLRLINQLLDMNKLEAGNMKVSYSRGDMAQFLEDCVSSFTQAARSRDISLDFKADVRERDYLFDPDKTEKIIYNILSNAIKFTPDGGRIEVEVYQDDRKDLVIKLRDSGIGISADRMDQIFSRFYQVDNSATRRYEGTGIGLALVKELLDILGGSISVQSEPGKGSVFQVTLPLVAASGEDVPRWISHGVGLYQADPGKDPGSGTIDDSNRKDEMDRGQQPLVIVVEDNVELREFISRSLAERYQVLTASNGIEALVLIRQHLPALVLSDVMMPEMDGYTMCREIKTHSDTDHIAVILLTAKAASASVIEGLSAGADDYITKPFQIEELFLRIQNILTQQARLREYFQKQLSDPAEKAVTVEKENAFIQQLYGIIEKHLDESSFTVELLAQQAAMSSKTLNRKLSSLTGLSANELIRQYRLKRSLDFLQAGNSVAQSAYSVGYESHAHFSTSFKTFFGVTPSEFQAKSN